MAWYENVKTGYEMTKMILNRNTCLKKVRNDQSVYEMTKMEIKVGTKLPKWYEMTVFLCIEKRLG